MNDQDLMERVHDNVYRIATPLPDTETQVYPVRGRQRALVDSGTADSVPERIEPALRALGLTLGDVDLVINTHPHWDHAGGNAQIRAAGRAQVLLHTAGLSPLGPRASWGANSTSVAYRARWGATTWCLRGATYCAATLVSLCKSTGGWLTESRSISVRARCSRWYTPPATRPAR